MNITCALERLQYATMIAERVVGKKESLPVLSCVLLEAKKKEGVLVRATNLETGVEVRVAADVSDGGIVAVPVSVFAPMIRSLRGEKVTLAVSEENLTITSPHGTATIKTIPADEFPAIGTSSSGTGYTLPTQTLVEGVQSVSYAAAVSLIRPELASIYVTHTDDTLVFVATDSFRLAEKRLTVSGTQSFPDILIPVKNAQELVHTLEHATEDEVTCWFDDSQLLVRVGSVFFISRVIDATFPNYKEIIPQSFDTEAVVLKNDLQQELKKARIFSQVSQQVGFHVYPSKKTLTLTARANEVGEMSDTLEAKLKGEDVDINFNIQYIADCLSWVRADSVTLAFSGTGKPLIITGVGDNSFRYLVMPLNR